MIAAGTCSIFSQSSTAMLFLLRALAIWKNHKYIMLFLSTFWVALVGAVTTIPIGIRGEHIGSTMQCMITRVDGYEKTGPVTVILYDSVIFMIIAYRILHATVYEEGMRPRLKAFFGSKKSIPNLSRALLRGGQKYYLWVVNCLTVTLFICSL